MGKDVGRTLSIGRSGVCLDVAVRMTVTTWSVYARRYLTVAGAASSAYLLVLGGLYASGWWQWRRDGLAIESPTKRYAVSHAVIVYPRLRFGLVLSDRETGSEHVVAGWTRGFPWSKEITWTADDRLRIEYFEQNSLRWGRKTEVMGVQVDWVLVSDADK